MKNFILLLSLVLLSFTFTSCSSESINDVKIKVAKQAQVIVEKELVKAYVGVEIEGYNCSSEASEIGVKVYDKVASFLQVKESARTKSLVGSALLIPVCKLVGEKYLPELIIGSSGGSYKCLKYIGAEGVKKISTELCSRIEI